MEKFFDLVAQHKKKVIAFCLILSIVLGFGMSRLEIRSILEGELPDDDFIIKTNNQFKEVFGDKSYIVFAFENQNKVMNTDSLAKLKSFSHDLRSFPGIDKEKILSLATFTQVEDSQDGLIIEPLLESVPATKLQIAEFTKMLKSNELVWERLISVDLTTVLVTAPIDKTVSEIEVYQAAVDLANKYQDPEELHYYSFQIIDQAIDQGINADLGLLFPLAIIIIAVLLYFCFSNLRAVILPLLVMIMAVVSTMGVMGWLSFKVSTVTSIIPVLIIALGSSYSIHLLERYFSVEKHLKTKALSLVARPIILAGMTSAIGFSTLVVFEIISLREFGIFSALGIIFTIFYNLLFCPAMLALLPQKKYYNGSMFLFGLSELTDYFLQKISKIIQKPRLVLLIAITLLIISIVGASQLQVGSNPTKFFPKDHQIRLTSELFNEKFGGTGVIEVMFETDETILHPETLQQVWQFQQFCENLEAVGNTNSVVNILRYMHKSLNKTETVPHTDRLIEQYLMLYSMDSSVDLDTFLDHSRQRLKVTIWMDIDDSQVIEQTYQQMRDYLEMVLPSTINFKFGGENMEWIAQNNYIVTGKIINIVASIIIIFLICTVVFRSLRLGLIAIVPLVFSTMLIFGMMGFLGIRLDLASCILTGVTVGVGVDFAIHYLSRFIEHEESYKFLCALEKTNLEAGKPILYDVYSNVLGFSVLMFSSFTPIRDFGVLIVFSMITCSLATLLFLPILCEKFFIRGEEE